MFLFTEMSPALVSFRNVMKMDPFRIDNFDLLSNLLYVSERNDELVDLSKYVASIDRYRQETLCILGKIFIVNSIQYSKQNKNVCSKSNRDIELITF